MKPQRLGQHRIVLVGAGHTHLLFLRKWGMTRDKGYAASDSEITLISNYPTATYSGMLPAALAGQCTASEMEIDLVPFCNSIGVRLLTNPVTGIDYETKKVLVAERPPIPFDVLSVGIGSIPASLPKKCESANFVPVKPMQTFLARLNQVAEQLKRNGVVQPRVIIVGGGVASIEIAFCLRPWLLSSGFSPEMCLMTRGDRIGQELESSTCSRVERQLAKQSTAIERKCEVTDFDGKQLHCSDGRTFRADLVIWTTGATPPSLVQSLGLETARDGFVAVRETLQTIALDNVFCVGDTATFERSPNSKAGVYAVRQAPVLWENVNRYLQQKPLIAFQPQPDFLRLINTGDGSAIGQWKGQSFSGKWVWWLKNRIDVKFMHKFQPIQMNETKHADVMQCNGCGCKLGSTSLHRALSAQSHATGDRNLQTAPNSELDDAATLDLGNDHRLLASTDFFSTPFMDPFLSGQIAAWHAASDILACGGKVRWALSNVVVPEGGKESQEVWLAEMLAGIHKTLSHLQARSVAGHTIVGPRAEVGLTMIGNSPSDKLTKTGLEAGDVLYLTKPLGFGVCMAANMRNLLDAAGWDDLLSAMLDNKQGYISAAMASGTRCATDVTGFGLLGHLAEMLDVKNSSRTPLTAELFLERLPFLPAAILHSQGGLRSSLYPDNFETARFVQVDSSIREDARVPLLYDPQTCGGFLIAIREGCETAFLDACRIQNLAAPHRIGEVRDEQPSDKRKPVRISKDKVRS